MPWPAALARMLAGRDEQNQPVVGDKQQPTIESAHHVGEDVIVGIAVGIAVMIVVISGISLLILLRRREQRRDIQEIIDRPQHYSQDSLARIIPDSEKQQGRFVV